MKKIAIASLIPLVGLSSCGTDVNTQSTTEDNTATQNTISETNTETALNNDIQTVETGSVEVVPFSQEYTLPGDYGNGLLEGELTLENGVITDIAFPNVDMSQTENKVVIFVNGVKSEVIGKEIEGLQIDTISGASLTTEAFNEFLANY